MRSRAQHIGQMPDDSAGQERLAARLLHIRHSATHIPLFDLAAFHYEDYPIQRFDVMQRIASDGYYVR